MLAKLSVRNMKRSVRDYLVYLLTMTLVAALMYAFNGLIFQNELENYFELVDIMAVMIGLASVFIVLIVAWLINYMVKFMLEKRSAEFGIYLLLGMKKKTIARLYMGENILLGALAFVIGLAAGILLQQVLMAVMFSMVRQEYRMHVSFNQWTILLTAGCYGLCYMLALFRCRRRFRKMNIGELMSAERKNEEIREKHESAKRILLPLSVLFLLLFWYMFGRFSDVMQIIVFLIGLVLTIYLFYLGLSAFIICYIRRGGNAIYRGHNLFLLRQFASKVRTMQFTMGTLTALFTLALMGASFGLMFGEYENTVLDGKFPFDVQLHSADPCDDFADDLAVIGEYADTEAVCRYAVYTDDEIRVNTWMLTNLENWGAMYLDESGEPDEAEIRRMLKEEGIYYPTDTYMGITDYNALRRMLGYRQLNLDGDSFFVHIKPRLADEITVAFDPGIPNAPADGFLSCAGINAEPFAQDGHNGADYIVVVPDEVLGRMRPLYAELAVSLKGEAPAELSGALDALCRKNDRDPFGCMPGDLCCGSDNIISYPKDNLVRDSAIPEIKYMLASIVIPMFYIGLVFVCAAMTVLAVQQLSDSAKYRRRYDLLGKLGVNRAAMDRLILKQLVCYYLCPALLAMVISGRMILYAGSVFVEMTGVPAGGGLFFAKTAALFFGIYLVYFSVTFVGFRRNIMPDT